MILWHATAPVLLPTVLLVYAEAALLNESSAIWSDPRLVYTVAAAAAALLVVTVWLFRRRRRTGRHAAVICLMVSVALHVALVVLVPLLPTPPGRSGSHRPSDDGLVGADAVDFHAFDSDWQPDDAATTGEAAGPGPLPVPELADVADHPQRSEATGEAEESDAPAPPSAADELPESLAAEPPSTGDQTLSQLDTALGEWIDTALSKPEPERSIGDAPQSTESPEKPEVTQVAEDSDARPSDSSSTEAAAQADSAGAVTDTASRTGSDQAGAGNRTGPSRHRQSADAPRSSHRTGLSDPAGASSRDFALRRGEAKQRALEQTGGDRRTEAAVAAALRFLTEAQGDDGAWDPSASGAGAERAPLGETRGGAGARAESAITGLALLALMGAGHTHTRGEYSENVYRGLAYLIRNQKPDGSLAGDASVYASTYSHGMAALAMAEAAAITGDSSAIEAAKRAVRYTERIQHPTTGGFRYTRGDPGDLSQLGWQAMVLEAAHRAGIQPQPEAVRGVQRFLRSVRAGRHGGLARYRPGEASSRTMTAEALATRLLIGETVPPEEIAEAERSMLEQPPGTGQDNYYYWYYATLALHQLQDEAWLRWNEALQRRLLETQKPSGSWPATTVWGGYGGTVYTTAMAALCLESYYRHQVRHRRQRVASGRDGETNR